MKRKICISALLAGGILVWGIMGISALETKANLHSIEPAKELLVKKAKAIQSLQALQDVSSIKTDDVNCYETSKESYRCKVDGNEHGHCYKENHHDNHHQETIKSHHGHHH